uniref:Sulfatase domain-containing protein n=1 Tax=Panagrellus redivivus TaxID=6233 RepID=A0A7E4UUV5_PANRE
MFVMADHGTRYGLTRLTAAGEREDNNPFLLMSVPGSLRGDHQLRTVIQSNARLLVSQYDMYATFVDIVAPHRPQNSSEPTLYGSSILKPLPQPRSCDRLRIPFEYCICDYPRTKMPDDSAPGREAAELMVKNMNNVINSSAGLSDYCVPLTLANAPVAVESYKEEGNLAIHKVTYKVEPGDGQFYGYVSQNVKTGKLSLLSSRLPRLNSYAKTAYCVKNDDFAAFCYCKDIDATTMPPATTASSFIGKLLG